MAEFRFDNRVAVVTGGGRGLGREHALLLAKRGAKVVINDIGADMAGGGFDAGPAEEVVQEIKAAGGEAVACTDTVATPEGGEAIIKKALDTWGRIDILVHNAGNTRRIPLKDYTQEDFMAVVNVHLMGAFHLVRPSFPLMLKQKYGRVVMTGSAVGIYGNKNAVPYAVSKAGMIGLCNNIALEGGDDNVKANMILPGAVTRLAKGLDTSFYPPTMGPELVAPVVAWLCHESCSVNAEMFSAMGARVSTAYILESKGVFRDDWTIESVAENMDAIRDRKDPVTFPPAPSGFIDHMKYSFDMARAGLAAKKK
jgi:NAD(P)-dependent dehydrogenase (short-subunit alcohol dehydrogenase family)